jgi:hypothetical protein
MTRCSECARRLSYLQSSLPARRSRRRSRDAASMPRWPIQTRLRGRGAAAPRIKQVFDDIDE